MKILITNDDGIYARGLWELAGSLKMVGEVIIAAPDRGTPGQGTKVTTENLVKATRIRPRAGGMSDARCYSVKGSPSDCVIMALSALVDDEIDLVVSGINNGANVGEDILISGTVGAALQGYLRGIPSIAVSVDAEENFDFRAASQVASAMVKVLEMKILPQRSLLNINVPNLPLNQIKGIYLTRLGRVPLCDAIECGDSGRDGYYLITYENLLPPGEEGTDVWAISHDMISISPVALEGTVLSASLVAHPSLERLVQTLLSELGIASG
ncbi:MAG: 5'/3'-nucleotidase SurE [Chloroflexi bacterium]|nr:5'/3'-nucleotidase SurE [Chloroflexota bacterium]